MSGVPWDDDLLFIAVFLWYYYSTYADECFLKCAAVTLHGNCAYNRQVLIRHRQMPGETRPCAIFADIGNKVQYWLRIW